MNSYVTSNTDTLFTLLDLWWTPQLVTDIHECIVLSCFSLGIKGTFQSGHHIVNETLWTHILAVFQDNPLLSLLHWHRSILAIFLSRHNKKGSIIVNVLPIVMFSFSTVILGPKTIKCLGFLPSVNCCKQNKTLYEVLDVGLGRGHRRTVLRVYVGRWENCFRNSFELSKSF